MDRLINNESIVICSVMSALGMDVNEISKLYLFAVLTGDRAIRKRLPGYQTYADLAAKESNYYLALNRKFAEFQPIFLNAMSMLAIGGKIEKTGNGRYELTTDGAKMALGLQEERKGVTAEILQAVFHLKYLLANKGVDQLYYDFKIVL